VAELAEELGRVEDGLLARGVEVCLDRRLGGVADAQLSGLSGGSGREWL
jgi:hypothetical protein